MTFCVALLNRGKCIFTMQFLHFPFQWPNSTTMSLIVQFRMFNQMLYYNVTVCTNLLFQGFKALKPLPFYPIVYETFEIPPRQYSGTKLNK